MSTDISGILRSVVETAGTVGTVYGGFEIRISDPAIFPWEKVFRLLLALQHEVWVEKREDQLLVISKPPPV